VTDKLQALPERVEEPTPPVPDASTSCRDRRNGGFHAERRISLIPFPGWATCLPAPRYAQAQLGAKFNGPAVRSPALALQRPRLRVRGPRSPGQASFGRMPALGGRLRRDRPLASDARQWTGRRDGGQELPTVRPAPRLDRAEDQRVAGPYRDGREGRHQSRRNASAFLPALICCSALPGRVPRHGGSSDLRVDMEGDAFRESGVAEPSDRHWRGTPVLVVTGGRDARFGDVELMEGDPTALETLRAAGAERAHAVLAPSDDDFEDAFVILARHELESMRRRPRRRARGKFSNASAACIPT
jgi:hypothetical protein